MASDVSIVASIAAEAAVLSGASAAQVAVVVRTIVARREGSSSQGPVHGSHVEWQPDEWCWRLRGDEITMGKQMAKFRALIDAPAMILNGVVAEEAAGTSIPDHAMNSVDAV